ncbi:MAG: NTPase [Candidatus Bathyarchaeota archaeon]
MKKLIFLTGKPGTGKTTVLKETIVILKDKGYKIGGMLSAEIRKGEGRVGFEILDILMENHGILAHINQNEGPRLGKYRVNLKDLRDVGANAIRRALAEANVVVVDEVGPMELFSAEFKKAMEEAIEGEKPVLGTIHYKARDPLLEAIRTHPSGEIVEVRLENRATLASIVAEKIFQES